MDICKRTFRSTALRLGVLVLVLVGCSDQGVVSPVDPGQVVEGRPETRLLADAAVPVTALTTSFWTPGQGGLTHQATYRTPLGSQGRKSPALAPGDAVPVQLSAGEIQRKKARLTQSWRLLSGAEFGSFLQSGGGNGASTYRAGVANATVQQSVADGRKIEIHQSSPPGQGARSRLAAVYVDGRLSSIREFRSGRRADGWEITEAMEIFFDAAGRPSLIVQHEVGVIANLALGAPMFPVGAEICEDPRSPSGSATAADASPFEVSADEGPCTWQKAAVAAAYMAYGAASLALATAIASCPLTALMSCSSVLTAYAVYMSAFALVASSEADLEACMERQRSTYVPGGTSGGGDPLDGESGPSCGSYIIEVSHDGGVTWHYLATVPAC